MFGKALNVEFVNNCVRFMIGGSGGLPVEGWLTPGQHAQGGLAGVRPFSHRQPAIELRREKYRFRIGVEQHLLRIEAVNVRSRLTRHRIPVVTGVDNFAERDAAMPYSS